jgi:hypothetical protein
MMRLMINKILFSVFLMSSIICLGQNEIDSVKNYRFSIHAQTTVINQFKPSFNVKYTGTIV